MRRHFAILVGTVAFAVFLKSQVTLLAEEKCPSAEACLSKTLSRNWEQYYSVIDRTWEDRKQVAELLRKVEARGIDSDIAELKAEQAKIEERWQFAKAVGRALTEPRLKNFLAAQKDEATRLHAAAQERVQKETELYRRLLKSTLKPERDSVTRDIASYERESHELRKTFDGDRLMVSLNSLEKAGGLAADGWVSLSKYLTKANSAHAEAVAATIPYVKAMEPLLAGGVASAEAVHAGMSMEEAARKNNNFEALCEATRGAGQFTLHAAEYIAKAPQNTLKSQLMRDSFGPLAARAGIWLNVVALGLDTLLTVKAVDRLKDAETRQVQVETNDAHWRAKVDAAARAASDSAAREIRAANQIERQQRIEGLLMRIAKEGG